MEEATTTEVTLCYPPGGEQRELQAELDKQLSGVVQERQTVSVCRGLDPGLPSRSRIQ